MIKGFVFGVLAAVILAVIGGFIGITEGLIVPANADASPSKFERWMASRSLHATLRREAPAIPNPVALTDENLIAGAKLYEQNCIVCHGAANGAPSNVAVGLYQKPPQLGKDGVEDDPEGVTFWKVKHGIRLTGMPAFTKTLSDEQIWQLSLFLKHMDKLPSLPNKKWESFKNPATLAPASAAPKHDDH